MDSCIEEMLDALGGGQYHITVRPHPQYVRHFEEKLNALAKKYEDNPNIELQTDFSSNKTVFDADVLITDWSGIAYEYAFTTLKPVLFINTPMKVMNPDYKEIDVVPFDIEARDQVGISVDTDALDTLPDAVYRLLTEEVYSKEALKKVREKYLYNVGGSAEVGAKYLLHQLIEATKSEVVAEVAEDTSSAPSGHLPLKGKAGKQKEKLQNTSKAKNRFLYSALILAFPVIMVWILGPLEIFAGNVGELFFGTGDFFWMFLAASMAAVAVGAVILSLLPDRVRRFLYTLIFAVSLCCYIQNLFLNLELIKTDGSKVDWSLVSGYSNCTILVWISLIVTVFVILQWGPCEKPVIITGSIGVCAWLISHNDMDDSKKVMTCVVICILCVILLWVDGTWNVFGRFQKGQTDPKKCREKVLIILSSFFVLVQTVAVISILVTNPYSVSAKERRMYALSSEKEFSVAPGKNIIVLILDRYGNKAYENMLEEEPEAGEILKDFTFYNNANSEYNYTFPSLTHMLTMADPMVSTTTTDRYKEQAWSSAGFGCSGDFLERLH